jgi:hypothetical protein
LIERGTPSLSKSFADIHAVAAHSDVAKKLEIQRGDVLLLLIARLYSDMGGIVDFSYSYFLPGYFAACCQASIELEPIVLEQHTRRINPGIVTTCRHKVLRS